jgi:hypothetical protein
MTTYIGEKPMEKGPSAFFPSFQPSGSDAYPQSLIDKLIKKADDLLSKPAPPKPAIPTPAPKLGKRMIERINGRLVDIGPAKD